MVKRLVVMLLVMFAFEVYSKDETEVVVGGSGLGGTYLQMS